MTDLTVVDIAEAADDYGRLVVVEFDAKYPGWVDDRDFVRRLGEEFTRRRQPAVPVAQPTREELIALMDRAVVPQEKWHNRDSASAQRQLGEGRALLLAGCPFVFDDDCDQDTWWITISYKGFDWFEQHIPSSDTCYIPTAKRLEARAGEDWY